MVNFIYTFFGIKRRRNFIVYACAKFLEIFFLMASAVLLEDIIRGSNEFIFVFSLLLTDSILLEVLSEYFKSKSIKSSYN